MDKAKKAALSQYKHERPKVKGVCHGDLKLNKGSSLSVLLAPHRETTQSCRPIVSTQAVRPLLSFNQQ
jgi:hypothetical protein